MHNLNPFDFDDLETLSRLQARHAPCYSTNEILAKLRFALDHSPAGTRFLLQCVGVLVPVPRAFGFHEPYGHPDYQLMTDRELSAYAVAILYYYPRFHAERCTSPAPPLSAPFQRMLCALTLTPRAARFAFFEKPTSQGEAIAGCIIANQRQVTMWHREEGKTTEPEKFAV